MMTFTHDFPGYRIPDRTAVGIRVLLDAVREGRAEDIPELLGALTDAERRKGLTALAQWRKDTPELWRGEGHLQVRQSLLLAGVGCCTGAAAATKWLTSRGLWWAWREKPQAVVGVLGARAPEWLAEAARRPRYCGYRAAWPTARWRAGTSISRAWPSRFSPSSPPPRGTRSCRACGPRSSSCWAPSHPKSRPWHGF